MNFDNNFKENFLSNMQEWFNSFVSQQKAEFTAIDIQSKYMHDFDSPLDPYTMNELLENNHFILNHPKKNLIFKRSQYFKDKTLKITPTNEEVFKKILIPGHRFIPFYSPDVMPFSCKLFWNDTLIPNTNYSISIRQAQGYCNLTPRVIDELLAMNEDNIKKMKRKDNIPHIDDNITIGVYDMEEFYNHHNFTVGDSIFVTVLDWDKGEFAISYANKSLFKNEARTKKWIHEMDEALTKVVNNYPKMWNPTEQFAYAFFYAQENNKLKESLCSIPEYLDHSQKIQLKNLIYHTFLWTKDETNLNKVIWDMTQRKKITRPWGLHHSLTCILDDLDTRFHGVLMQSMLWCEFEKGHTVAQDLLYNVFPDLPQDIKDYPFVNDEQRNAFPKYWRQYVKEEKKRYNPFKSKKWRDIRISFSDILIDFYRWKNEVFLKHANFRKPMVSWLQLYDLITEIEAFIVVSINEPEKESLVNVNFEVTGPIYDTLKSQVMQDITSGTSLQLLPTLNKESQDELEKDKMSESHLLDMEIEPLNRESQDEFKIDQISEEDLFDMAIETINRGFQSGLTIDEMYGANLFNMAMETLSREFQSELAPNNRFDDMEKETSNKDSDAEDRESDLELRNDDIEDNFVDQMMETLNRKFQESLAGNRMIEANLFNMMMNSINPGLIATERMAAMTKDEFWDIVMGKAKRKKLLRRDTKTPRRKKTKTQGRKKTEDTKTQDTQETKTRGRKAQDTKTQDTKTQDTKTTKTQDTKTTKTRGRKKTKEEKDH